MRGTIEVSGSPPDPELVSIPLYVTLGLDIDVPHNALHIPTSRPSAINGQQLAANLSIDRSTIQTPVDFTDAARMLGVSPAILQGKILRGGMGTGMPMWGSISTEEQIWNLIAHIYSF